MKLLSISGEFKNETPSAPSISESHNVVPHARAPKDNRISTNSASRWNQPTNVPAEPDQSSSGFSKGKVMN